MSSLSDAMIVSSALDLQEETRQSLMRIEAWVAACRGIAAESMVRLEEQEGQQEHMIDTTLPKLLSKQKETRRLQWRMALWSGRLPRVFARRSSSFRQNGRVPRKANETGMVPKQALEEIISKENVQARQELFHGRSKPSDEGRLDTDGPDDHHGQNDSRQLERIEQGDRELEAVYLASIEGQLEELHQLAQTMGSATKRSSIGMNQLESQVRQVSLTRRQRNLAGDSIQVQSHWAGIIECIKVAEL